MPFKNGSPCALKVRTYDSPTFPFNPYILYGGGGLFKVFSKRKFNIVLGCSLIVFVTTHQLSPNGCRIEKCQVYFLVCSIR